MPPIGSYPIHYRKAFLHTDNWQAGYRQIGYINIPVLKHVLQERSIIRLIEKRLDNSRDQYVLVYTMYPPYVRACARLKQKHPNIHICLLQTDPILGKDGTFTKNSVRNIRKGQKLIKLMKCFDSFVVLTKYLAEAMEIGDRPYTIVDCIINDAAITLPACNNNKDRRRFLYTGSTRSSNGIKTLVDAFEYLPDAELWICGSGDSDDYIREKDRKLNNVSFFGSIDHCKIADIQAQCDYMINPRTPAGGLTKYSFPSKTAEYMMTGKPTVMYKLEGLSDDYDELLTFIYSEDPKGLADELKEILNTDQLQLLARARRARNYVMREKSPEAQAGRIISMWERGKCI